MKTLHLSVGGTVQAVRAMEIVDKATVVLPEMAQSGSDADELELVAVQLLHPVFEMLSPPATWAEEANDN